ncbi:MAG TPA: hypothetical protein VE733_04045 [Streptosporangiaceae bacterium]|nr:hypothetical protein [Streptosporangiaceae bacterium]
MAAVVLFFCYLRQSRTVTVGADGGSIALQAWDMLHGNALLQGWGMSDVSFYSTELVQYVLLEALHGLGPDVIHIGGAMTYTLLLLLAGLVAKGRAGGREGLVRVLVAGGIMLAPALGNATSTLLLTPDHLGSAVPVLLAWLLVERLPQRWYVPVAVCVVLVWGQVADLLVLLTGVAPLVIVCGIRVGQKVWRREPLKSQWYELALIAAALASVGLMRAAEALIRISGGFVLQPVAMSFAGWSAMPQHLLVTGEGLLTLFGASFFGPEPSNYMIFAVLHVAGVAAVAWAFCVAIRRFARREELIVPALVLAIVLNVAAYVPGTYVANLLSTREISEVLPFGAVLAGRLLAGPIVRAGRAVRLVLGSLGITCLVCYAAAAGYGAAQAAVPAQNQDLVAFLMAHGLRSGLAGYWQANSVTLDSGGQIVVRPVKLNAAGLAVANLWEAKASWYDPRANQANFVVTVSRPPSQEWQMQPFQARDTFGHPVRTYRFGRYTILVWHTNLLAHLGQGVDKSVGP